MRRAFPMVGAIEREMWTLETGANRLDRITTVERAFGAIVVSLSFTGEN